MAHFDTPFYSTHTANIFQTKYPITL